MYRLHCFAQSGNCYKVALMLNACGVPWEPVFVDFFNGETRTPAYRAKVNEMGEAPVLDLGGRLMSQSGIILDHLARETGRFLPESAEGREECWRWVLFDNHKFTSYLATHRFLRSFVKGADPAVIAFFKGRVEGVLGIVETHLAGRAFLLGEEPTIADLSLAGYVFYPPEETGVDIPAAYPAIEAWRKRIADLPGWKHPHELMPGHPLPQG